MFINEEGEEIEQTVEEAGKYNNESSWTDRTANIDAQIKNRI